jgi:hypothetical protein
VSSGESYVEITESSVEKKREDVVAAHRLKKENQKCDSVSNRRSREKGEEMWSHQ